MFQLKVFNTTINNTPVKVAIGINSMTLWAITIINNIKIPAIIPDNLPLALLIFTLIVD